MRNEVYQDIWIRGEIKESGDRPCSKRWEVINNFLQRFSYPRKKFEVLDFGANMGYFSFKTAYQYPTSTVTMIDYEPKLPSIYESNHLPNVELVHKYMDVSEIESFLKDKHYDVIYAMSVLHHFEDYKKVVELFMKHSDTVIFEIGYPCEKPLVNVERVRPIYEHIHRFNPIQINTWVEHDRPIYYVNSKESSFKGSVHVGAHIASTKTFNEIGRQIEHTFGEDYYPGTLNVRLEEPVNLINHFYLAEVYKIFPVYLNGFPCYCIHPKNDEMPTVNLEIMSPEQLRRKFNLKEEGEVIVSFNNRYLRG